MEGVAAGNLLGAGCYALLYRKEVVYVGKSTLLLVRLYQHRNNYQRNRKGSPVKGMTTAKAILFDDVLVYPCERQRLDVLERQLIAQFRPRHNEKLVPKLREPIAIEINGVSVVLNGATPAPARTFERRL